MNKFIDFLGKIRINHHQVIQLSSDYSRQKILAKEKTNAVVINTDTIALATSSSHNLYHRKSSPLFLI